MNALAWILAASLVGGPFSPGERGDWSLTFEDGSTLSATAFSATNALLTVVGETVAGETRTTYRSPAAEVTVVSRERDGVTDIVGRVRALGKTVTDVALPARLRFDPTRCARVVFPADKAVGTGYSLKGAFFDREKDVERAFWARDQRPRKLGPSRVYRGRMRYGALDEPTVPVRVTDEGRALLPAATVSAIEAWRQFRVNRVSAPEDSDIVLVDSEHGGFVTASRCGGSGALWRIGQADPRADGKIHRELARGLVAAAVKGRERPQIAVIALARGPERGSFVAGLGVGDVLAIARQVGAVTELREFSELQQAWRSKAWDCIVNPYGECVPCLSPERLAETETAVADYVRRGGVWVELGGATFCAPLCPRLYHSCQDTYPALFCDFVRHEGTDGTAMTLYAVRSRRPFVPGKLGCGGDPQGGWIDHGFVTWIRPGETWTSPTVRIRRGGTLQEAADAYVRDNGLTRTLAEKAGSRLAAFRQAPLVKLEGTAAEMRQAIGHLAPPALVHVSRYLRGGFDRQYPDHLPPAPSFGTAAEFRALIDELHAHGHFFSPYTNPTWWCDNPKGPTFLAEGEGAIAIGRDGRKCRCSYGVGATGYAVTLAHPAVRAANRRTREQFTGAFPCDLLFQDECGARRMAYDFNPASPSPTAYVDGILSLLDEDSSVLPLGTEEGWDQVANREVALCGLHWRTIPLSAETQPQRELAKSFLPPHLWSYENLAQRMMHDKCLFLLHDLGGFVHDARSLAWTLALGYHLSVRFDARELAKDNARTRWYRWISELQRRVVSRMDGGKAVSFVHDRAPLFARGGDPRNRLDDGVVRAQYGEVKVIVNLGDVPRTVEGHHLAAYGWRVTAPKLVAAALEGRRPYVADDGTTVEFDLKGVAQCR